MKFEVRAGTFSDGPFLGVVEGTSYPDAAQKAAAKFFKQSHAARYSGWAGRAGSWVAYEGDAPPPITEKRFYLKEAAA